MVVEMGETIYLIVVGVISIWGEKFLVHFHVYVLHLKRKLVSKKKEKEQPHVRLDTHHRPVHRRPPHRPHVSLDTHIKRHKENEQ